MSRLCPRLRVRVRWKTVRRVENGIGKIEPSGSARHGSGPLRRHWQKLGKLFSLPKVQALSTADRIDKCIEYSFNWTVKRWPQEVRCLPKVFGWFKGFLSVEQTPQTYQPTSNGYERLLQRRHKAGRLQETFFTLPSAPFPLKLFPLFALIISRSSCLLLAQTKTLVI